MSLPHYEEQKHETEFPVIFCTQANTAKLPWLERLWKHENMFETGVVPTNECYSKRKVRRHNRDSFFIFFNMKVCCLFSLESPN